MIDTGIEPWEKTRIAREGNHHHHRHQCFDFEPHIVNQCDFSSSAWQLVSKHDHVTSPLCLFNTHRANMFVIPQRCWADLSYGSTIRPTGITYCLEFRDVHCLPTTASDSLTYYLAHRWGENRWIHVFPKVICANVNTTMSTGIWTRLVDFSFGDFNHSTSCTSTQNSRTKYYDLFFFYNSIVW